MTKKGRGLFGVQEEANGMNKKYYIAYDYIDEFSGEVLAVTTNKRHAVEACRRRKDETGGECYTKVEIAERKEDALKIAREAEKKGYTPIFEVEQ